MLAEASFAPKQAGGPWAAAMRRPSARSRQADVVLALTARDAECLAPLLAPPAELRRLPPFLDPAPYQAARRSATATGRRSRRSFGLDPDAPWLLAVAMMRADVKRDSYLLLADALGRLRARAWQLLVVGDGPARPEIEAALRRLGGAGRASPGALPEAALPAYYAAADFTSGRRSARRTGSPCSRRRRRACR